MNEYMESFFLYDPWDAASPELDPSPLDPSPFEVMEPELPESVPVPDPPSVPPSEVISVDELLDRLKQGIAASDADEADEADDTSAEDVIEEISEAPSDSDIVPEDPSRDHALFLLESIQQDVHHSFWTTDFSDYTVTEGFLLLALVMGVLVLCGKMLKGGFSWLWS